MFLLSSIERGSSVRRLLFFSALAAVRSPLIVGSLNDYPVIDDISNSLSGFGGDFSNCSQSGADIVSRQSVPFRRTRSHSHLQSPQKYMLPILDATAISGCYPALTDRMLPCKSRSFKCENISSTLRNPNSRGRTLSLPPSQSSVSWLTKGFTESLSTIRAMKEQIRRLCPLPKNSIALAHLSPCLLSRPKSHLPSTRRQRRRRVSGFNWAVFLRVVPDERETVDFSFLSF